jgi:hypothetical protein
MPAMFDQQPVENSPESKDQPVEKAISGQTSRVEKNATEQLEKLPPQLSNPIGKIYRDADRLDALRFLNISFCATLVIFALFVIGAFTGTLPFRELIGCFIVSICLGLLATFLTHSLWTAKQSPEDEETCAAEVSRRLQAGTPPARRRPIDSHFGEESEMEPQDFDQRAVTNNPLPLPDESPEIEPSGQTSTDVQPK